jgi:hypothetical protein
VKLELRTYISEEPCASGIYHTDAFGYGVNDFVSKGAMPVFWTANVRTDNALSFGYQRNAFHTRHTPC